MARVAQCGGQFALVEIEHGVGLHGRGVDGEEVERALEGGDVRLQVAEEKGGRDIKQAGEFGVLTG